MSMTSSVAIGRCIYITDVLVGDYVLSAGRAADSGPGLHSNLAWSL